MTSYEKIIYEEVQNTLSDTQRIQIRIGQNSPKKLKKWADNQTNLNESVKKIIDHFIDMYGDEDLDSLDVKLKMARDLVAAQGNNPEPLKVPEKVVILQEPEEISEETVPIIDRGEIDL